MYQVLKKLEENGSSPRTTLIIMNEMANNNVKKAQKQLRSIELIAMLAKVCCGPSIQTAVTLLVDVAVDAAQC